MRRLAVVMSVAVVAGAAVWAQTPRTIPEPKTAPAPVSAAVDRGAQWLASVQGADGGCGQDGGKTSSARPGERLESSGNDVANTAVAALALLQAGQGTRRRWSAHSHLTRRKTGSPPYCEPQNTQTFVDIQASEETGTTTVRSGSAAGKCPGSARLTPRCLNRRAGRGTPPPGRHGVPGHRPAARSVRAFASLSNSAYVCRPRLIKCSRP